MLAGAPSAERLLRAHRAGFSQLSQRQLEQLIAKDPSLDEVPDMDPSVCGLCGFWVRRCTCRAGAAGLHSAPYVEEDGLLGSLPRELLLLIGSSLSIAMLGHLASVSKELRQLAYSECLWSALRAAAPWAPQLAVATSEPRGSLPNNVGARAALRHEAAVEDNWRAGRWRLSRLALEQQCRESERPREVACVSFDADFVILTALDPPTLQLWRLGSLTLAHSLRSRSATRFFCALLPPAPDSPRQLHALSCDCRERHGTLRLWDVRTGTPIAKLKAHASRVRPARLHNCPYPLPLPHPHPIPHPLTPHPDPPTPHQVLCACFCAERGQPASADYRPPLLASADEQGRCVLWQLQGCEAAEPQSGSQPRPLAIFQMESAIECLLLQGSLLACGSRDGCVTLVNPVNPRPPRTDGALPAIVATGADVAGAASGAAAHEVGVHPPGVRLLGHTDWVTHVQLAGRAAATESDEGGAAAPTPPQWLCTASRDRSLRVWCVRSRTCLHELRCHSRWINGLAISSYRPPARDLGRLAACSPLAGAAAAAAAEQPAEAEHFAVTASADGTLAVWRLRDGRQLATLRGHTRAVTCFQLSGTRVVSASMDRTILAWELAPLLARSTATAEEEATATAGEGAVETAAAEGAAAFAEDDDAPGGGDTAPIAPVAPAAEDGEALAVAEAAEAAEAVEVIDDTPDECKLFEVSDAHEDFVRCVCFDHHKLLSCADDGRVYLFSFDA